MYNNLNLRSDSVSSLCCAYHVAYDDEQLHLVTSTVVSLRRHILPFMNRYGNHWQIEVYEKILTFDPTMVPEWLIIGDIYHLGLTIVEVTR